MKVLCVADHVDPRVYSPAIKERFGDVSLVISCGDLPFEYYDFIQSNLNKPLLFVFGNHNLNRIGDYDRRYRPAPEERPAGFEETPPSGGIYIDGRVVMCRGLIVAGLGGSFCYNKGQNQFTERRMLLNALKLVPSLLWHRLAHGRYLDVLVTHAPPEGVHEGGDLCHRGFKTYNRFINFFKPKYLVHGHIHLYGNQEERRTVYRQTAVVNAFDHYILEI